MLNSGSWRRLPFLLLLLFASVPQAFAAPARIAHYDVALRVEPDNGRIAVDARLQLPPAKAGDEVELVLGQSYAIEKVEAPGATITTEPTTRPFGGLQRVLLRYGDAVARPTLRLVYAGALNPSGDPPLNMVTPDLVELNLDSMWLPIGSDLKLPFTADATIRGLAPDAVVVSQGQVRREGEIVRIRRTEPGIDLPLLAGRGLQREAGPGLELYGFDLGSPGAARYRNHVPRSLAFLQRVLGTAPPGSVQLVISRRPRVSGYARPGYVVVTEPRDASEMQTAKFVGHEFAHSWFRHADPTSEERWIDEGFAEYLGIRYVGEVFGSDARTPFLEGLARNAAKAGPVLGRGLQPGNEIYAKAPMLIFALHERIGTGPMDRFLARLASRRAGTTAAVMTALKEVAGQETAAWFEAELRR